MIYPIYMLPPTTPKLAMSTPHINPPIVNNVSIPGQTQRAGAYLVQAVSSQVDKLK
jgi:hypothetical protein